MLAMTVFANTGHTDIPEPLTALASEEEFRQAIAWGLAVRLCRKLTGGAAEALGRTALKRKGERLVLEFERPVQALASNGVAKSLRLLADWLGLDWSVEFPAAECKAG